MNAEEQAELIRLQARARKPVERTTRSWIPADRKCPRCKLVKLGDSQWSNQWGTCRSCGLMGAQKPVSWELTNWVRLLNPATTLLRLTRATDTARAARILGVAPSTVTRSMKLGCDVVMDIITLRQIEEILQEQVPYEDMWSLIGVIKVAPRSFSERTGVSSYTAKLMCEGKALIPDRVKEAWCGS